MNENLNLAEILKDCPMGTKLYSPAYGDVKLAIVSRSKDAAYPIEIELSDGIVDGFTKDGRIDVRYPGECMLFPSREQRDWGKFKPDKHKFDPKTLQPFDKVLVRDRDVEHWSCNLFSYIVNDEYLCVGSCYKYCIPYNEDTKHLVDTSKEAPEFYRYWED